MELNALDLLVEWFAQKGVELNIKNDTWGTYAYIAANGSHILEIWCCNGDKSYAINTSECFKNQLHIHVGGPAFPGGWSTSKTFRLGDPLLLDKMESTIRTWSSVLDEA